MVHNPTNRPEIRLATNTVFRRREKQKALSESVAFENGPIQRLLNGQIGVGKGLHYWTQRRLAHIRHLLAGVRRNSTMSNDTQQ